MTTSVESLFRAPGPHPNGMQATPEGLWVLDQHDNQLSLLSYAGKVVRTLDTASDRGSGVTDDGDAIWLASTYSRQILRVDRNSGATLAVYDSPDASKTGSHGLEWRDGMLWVANPPSARIYQIDVTGGFRVVHSIPAPGNRPHGIAWQGGDLWCVETNQRAIYRLDVSSGAILDKIDIPEPNPEPHGMTIWDGSFYYCDANTTLICRLPLPG
jgi:streptogramin lyase